MSDFDVDKVLEEAQATLDLLAREEELKAAASEDGHPPADVFGWGEALPSDSRRLG